MRFRFNPEHEELRRAVRRFFADLAGEPALRRDMATEAGWDPAVWRRVCDELELPALAVPEEHGGAGFGLVELGIALGEAGRVLLCGPLLSTSIAIQALLAADDPDAAAAHLPSLAAGTTIGSLAAREQRRDWDAAPATLATPGPDGWTLTGRKDWVLDGHTAQLLIVTATAGTDVTAEGPATSLFLVDAGAAGLSARPLGTVDPTRKAAEVTFDATPATPLGTVGGGDEPLRRTLDRAVTLLAAEQVGVARTCLASATTYAGQRHQFGRPIGSFQAIKHKLADVLLEVEAAEAAAMYATWAADNRPDELAEAACVAGATCSEAALLSAGESIQVHGGMGVTWEHSAHLFLKRATVSRLLLRSPAQHLDRLARLTGIDDAFPPGPAAGPAPGTDVTANGHLTADGAGQRDLTTPAAVAG
ncbi:acyl-CoA dehydrogenase family protein [Parafrankia sp. FMc2]|uniref:acyl-CoA dehydrogenase family protein n=1 Tax=Parafrankia sp. FMc2 TaxID=3233196 RepID=UPI0034D46AA4